MECSFSLNVQEFIKFVTRRLCTLMVAGRTTSVDIDGMFLVSLSARYRLLSDRHVDVSVNEFTVLLFYVLVSWNTKYLLVGLHSAPCLSGCNKHMHGFLN